MTVLVTGASGHLGANLVRRLLADGRRVRALLRTDADAGATDGLDLERVVCDLRDEDAVARAADGCETAFHCAANVSTIQGDAAHKDDIYRCNVIGTRNLLAAAARAGLRRVVVTGSLSATGFDPENPSLPVDEEVPFYPFTRHLPYAHTKVLVEHECLKAAARGLDVVVCTSTAIIGPNDFKPSRMGRVLIDFAHGKLPMYVPGGFEFVAARDIAEGHVLAMERGKKGEKYIVSSGFATMDEMMTTFEEVTGAKKPRRLPSSLVYGLAKVSDVVIRRFFPSIEQLITPDAVLLLRTERHADTSKARRELGFVPTRLADAVRLAYEDFSRRGLVPSRGATRSKKAANDAPAQEAR
jgi:nucleoside-diphosphate-sugar epimerase